MSAATRAQRSHLRLVSGGCSQHLTHDLATRVGGHPPKFESLIGMQGIDPGTRRAHLREELLLRDEGTIEAVEAEDDETLRRALVKRGKRFG